MASPSSEAELSVVLDYQLDLGSSGVIHEHKAGIAQRRAEIERLLKSSSAFHEKQKGLRYLRECRSESGKASLTAQRLDDCVDRGAGCCSRSKSAANEHRRGGDAAFRKSHSNATLFERSASID